MLVEPTLPLLFPPDQNTSARTRSTVRFATQLRELCCDQTSDEFGVDVDLVGMHLRFAHKVTIIASPDDAEGK
jgi:hypothetical protein